MTISFSPKSFLVKIAEVFQGREGIAPNGKTKVRNISEANTAHSRVNNLTVAKPKLNVSLDDLKTISTALLQYRRTLSKIGEGDKAENVARIDKQFYALIQDLEEQASIQEMEEEFLASAA